MKFKKFKICFKKKKNYLKKILLKFKKNLKKNNNKFKI